jgi:pimeloyl-ACP methyl ester carboxylesterase
MRIRTKDVSFLSGAEQLTGRVFLPADENGGSHPAMVLVHGLGSGGNTMDESARELAQEGIIAFRFDQRGHGPGTSVYDGDSSDDVLAAAAFLRGDRSVDANCVGVLGHSSGARDAIVACAKDPSLNILVCTSTPSDIQIGGEEDSSFVRRTGVLETGATGGDHVSRYPQEGPLPWLDKWPIRALSWISGWARGYRLRVDWRATFEAWDRSRPSIAITEMTPRPTLFVHCENDRTSSVEGVEILFMKASDPKEFFVHPGGYHSTPLRRGKLRSAWVAWIGEQMVTRRQPS